MTTASDWWFRSWWHQAARHGESATEAYASMMEALLSAPESVRLELAALLNPWRTAESAPKNGNDFQGLLLGDQQVVVFYDEPSADAPSHCWHRADGIAYHRDALIAWAPLLPLPAPPLEEK